MNKFFPIISCLCLSWSIHRFLTKLFLANIGLFSLAISQWRKQFITIEKIGIRLQRRILLCKNSESTDKIIIFECESINNKRLMENDTDVGMQGFIEMYLTVVSFNSSPELWSSSYPAHFSWYIFSFLCCNDSPGTHHMHAHTTHTSSHSASGLVHNWLRQHLYPSLSIRAIPSPDVCCWVASVTVSLVMTAQLNSISKCFRTGVWLMSHGV